MVLTNEHVNQLSKERADLIRKLDADPDNESLKDDLKLISEKLELSHNEVLPKKPVIVQTKIIGSDGKKIKVRDIIRKAWNEEGIKDCQEIAKKYGLKIDSVRWYKSNLKLV